MTGNSFKTRETQMIQKTANQQTST